MPPRHLILADECVHREVIARLRAAGFEVNAVAEGYASAIDDDVLTKAVETEAVLLTNDRDFGELVFHHRRLPPICILYVRTRTQPPHDVARRLVTLLEDSDLNGHLIVLDDTEIRRRPYPREVI